MTDSHEQPLKAAAFSPQSTTPEAIDETGNRRPQWLIPAFVILLVAAIAVFIILPSVISTPDVSTPVDTASVNPTSQSTASSTDDLGEERSPFAEAQQQKLRKLAQDALQVVLEAQEALQEFSVDSWAPEAYAAALAIAEAGDEAYRERLFVDAAAAYQEAAAASTKSRSR